MTFQKENDIMLNNLFENLFFNKWKSNIKENRCGIELILNDNCDLKCKYCYFRNPKLYVKKPPYDEVMKNLDKVLYWMKDNEYKPKEIALFSGDTFSDDLGIRALERIIEFIETEYRVCEQVVIPTNALALMENKDVMDRFIKVENRYKLNKVVLGLSLSFDGKYVEEFRPAKSGFIRDDKHYSKIFKFAKEHGCGFHPMLYSKAIKNWKKNFLWFQDMLTRYCHNWHNIYLLEVRNDDWSVENCKDLYNFIKFLIRYTYDRSDNDVKTFFKNFRDKKCFNIISAPFVNTGRGIGCGIQSFFYINLMDMRIVPCHRTMYECFTYGKFIIENEKIVGIESQNVEIANAIYSFDGKTLPMCQSCPINKLCNFACLGASYEATGDLFTASPVICRLEHYKLKALVDGFREIGILNTFLDNFLSNDKREALVKTMEDGII